MSNLNQQTFRDIVNLLIPHCADPASRKSLAENALHGCQILNDIDSTGAARDFTVRFVRQLLTYGQCEVDKPAIVMLLTTLHAQVGFAQKSQIDELIAKIPLETVSDADSDWHVPDTPTGKHIFISYSRGNLDMVRQITTDLLNAGINMWIDEVGLKPGTPDWEQTLRDAIHDAEAVLYMASPTARRSKFVRDELATADMEQVPIYPVWVDGDQWMDCIPFGRGYVQFIDVREGAYATGLQQIANALTGETVKFETAEIPVTSEPVETIVVDTSQPPRNPYKGLRSFRAEDEADFFGRDSLIEALIQTLGNGIEAPRLLGVLGASGSGKSSVVMAGLLPRLKTGAIEGSENWLYLDPLVPGTQPIESLTIALRREMKDTAPKHIREELQDPNKRGLHALTCELSDKPIVLYIDQFEELFTLVDAEAERRQFIDLLTTAITEASGILIVILSMRADFYDRAAQYQELGRLTQDNHVLVTPMSLADLYDVVQSPAQQPDVQLSFEEGLVTELVYAVREEVAALPLLQFTLEQLFEQRTEHTLTLQAYEAMGGVQGALAQHAEDTFTNLPSEQHQLLARALFLRLIEAGATEQDTTRRRASMSELTLPDAENTRILQETANAFVDGRLLISDLMGDERTIEVSHEALIREWSRLGDWLRDAREDLRLQKSLSADVAEWKRRGQADDMLYRGTVLTDGQSWSERNTANRDETMFLHESEKAQAEQKRQAAQTAQRMRLLAFGLVGVLVIASIGLTLVFAQNNAELQTEASTLEAHADNVQAQVDIAQFQAEVALGQADIAQSTADMALAQASTSQFQAEYIQAQGAWIATFVPPLGGFPIAMDDLTQTPVLDFLATATALAEFSWEIQVEDFDGVEMVLVPAGCFWMGSLDGDSHESSDGRLHEICFDGSYWIDRYEVSNKQFEALEGVAAGTADWPEPQQPRTSITWFEARDFCALRGARLPTEAEWEFAARGPNSQVYPWGNDFVEDNVEYFENSGGSPAAVGSRESGASWVGAYDMSGNVWEWVHTIYDNSHLTGEFPYPYATDDGREDSERTDVLRVLRGGSYFTDFTYWFRSAYRFRNTPDDENDSFGFRCVRS